MKRFFFFLLSAILCLTLLGCTPRMASRTFFAMDTVMTISATGDEELLDGLQTMVQRLEKLLSVTDPESEVYALNHNGSAALSPNTREILEDALHLCAETGGALDITVYPAMCAWGFTTDKNRVPDDAELAELLPYIDYRQVILEDETAAIPEGVMVDLGAVAKGYTALVLTQMLRDMEVESALLDLGGNIQAIGENPEGRPWGVAIQHPGGEGYLGILNITDKAVVTSGGYERNFEQDGEVYHHILDPKTGKPARSGLQSVTVVGTSGLTCDALSTALYVMGYEKAIDLWRSREDFECILMDDSGHIYITEGLEGSFAPQVSDYTIVERG